MKTQDTIFACASLPSGAAGGAAVALVRLCGAHCMAALQSLLQTQTLPPPRQICVRSLYHPRTGVLLDKAMVVRFVAPHSFSGEDMVELHCHGGAAVLRSLLAALAGLDNMRVAAAGEFTRRAVLAGRLDLTQAEAIADLVAAEGS
ncbi:MAG: tRNA uridine-5-carboxymethylaminomethyl(34) synthesis GTPase MnmE, partial [Alphaproteobacteria bacterium]|nr:tRNA uridine-5-carboxymethylaminomethyl(34) synthesis GTPase MnmE [Alphaproteobacteria bacterium]